MALKHNDYIEINYTGRTKDDQEYFDTTSIAIAKEHGLFKDGQVYKPIIICLGKQHVLYGIDKQLVGKDIGKFTIEVKDEEGFGKKNPKLIKLMPLNLFTKEGIGPKPGLEVNVDGSYGIVKSVSGGRVVVDFNHPLSGKDLIYDVEILRVIEEPKEKIQGMLDVLGIATKSVEITGKKAAITTTMQLPEILQKAVIKDIKETVPVDEVDITVSS